jgi:hypothetical protein
VSISAEVRRPIACLSFSFRKDNGLHDSGGPGFTVVARGHGSHDVAALHERQSGVSAASSQNASSGVMTLLAHKD